jgi:hypothetical protein
MCWNMCAEYRYSSLTSWSGQSEPNHTSPIAATKHTRWRRVTTGAPGATAFGPITRTM